MTLLPVASKFNRNENHLMLLTVISKMDEEDIATDVEKLSELGKFFKTHVEYMLENLLEEGLILVDEEKKMKSKKGEERGATGRGSAADDRDSSGESSVPLSQTSITLTIKLPRNKRLVEIHDFSLTRKGQVLLEEKKKELAKLSVAMQRLYNKKDIDELYRAIFWNREWMPLMLYTGVLTTEYLKAMMKLLGLDVNRLSMTETQETLDGLGIDPGLLTMGLFLAHPLLAFVSYVICLVTVGKLEQRKPEKVRKINEAKGKLEGDLYIPRTD